MTTSQYFTRATRDDGTGYTRLVDDQPDWLYDAVRDAHDGELPNDWRFETCAAIAALIDDGDGDPHSIADGLVDVYTSDLLAWLTPERMAYVDEALEECLVDATTGVESIIRTGQYVCITHMASILVDAVSEATL